MSIGNIEVWKFGSQKLFHWSIHYFLFRECPLGKYGHCGLRIRRNFPKGNPTLSSDGLAAALPYPFYSAIYARVLASYCSPVVRVPGV